MRTNNLDLLPILLVDMIVLRMLECQLYLPLSLQPSRRQSDTISGEVIRLICNIVGWSMSLYEMGGCRSVNNEKYGHKILVPVPSQFLHGLFTTIPQV